MMMCGRFEGPTPAYPTLYPAWRRGRLWDTVRGQGIEWSIGVDHRSFFHLMFAKGGMYRQSVAVRIVLWRLGSFFAEVRLPREPRPFEFFFDTNPWTFDVGRPHHA